MPRPRGSDHSLLQMNSGLLPYFVKRSSGWLREKKTEYAWNCGSFLFPRPVSQSLSHPSPSLNARRGYPRQMCCFMREVQRKIWLNPGRWLTVSIFGLLKCGQIHDFCLKDSRTVQSSRTAWHSSALCSSCEINEKINSHQVESVSKGNSAVS